ncbi:hypothetical protein GF108_08900 [Phyllobacterium sp. SYP-B3895]|uniref:hypothetical protein n=1 Tax=Phyllobacterium sp. SYP-B3895 TaxID=2663240 RepID=UPI0012999021|nr:hypothetical protein [Phyllobacterium sp. SYP-B3895]MRG55699.1 hypothetical protein [Phyllobacterium sp. SYP-B3895]
MLTAQEHNAVVDFLMASELEGNALMEATAAQFPRLTFGDLGRASLDARDRLKERGMVNIAEGEAMLQLLAIFDGLPETLTFDEAIAIKVKQGDQRAMWLRDNPEYVSSLQTRIKEALAEKHAGE